MNQGIQRVKLLLMILLLFCSIVLHRSTYNQFPMYVHAWAQSDHLALAHGFLDNGFDLFHPQTYLLNKQFPHDFNLAYPTSETAVDLPIHAYIVALLMNISGNETATVFRIYTLLWSLFGIWMLTLLLQNVSRRPITGVILAAMAAFSPVFVYYQDGMLPTIPCIAALITGVWAYEIYQRKGSQRYFFIALIWLTMAALWRSSYAVALIALVMTEVWMFFSEGRKNIKSLGWIALAALLPVTYTIYNAHLREQVGSLFLSSPTPVRNLEEFSDLLDAMVAWALGDYQFAWNWLILVPLILLGLFLLFAHLISFKPKSRFYLFAVIYLGGISLFSLLMMRQFRHHDYYFIDILFLPLFLLSALGLSVIPTRIPFKLNTLFTLLLLIFPILSFVRAKESQKDSYRLEPWDRFSYTALNYAGADSLLDAHHVPKYARILAIDAYAPNIPFLMMKRQGLVNLSTTRENLINHLKFPFDFVTIQNDYFFSDVFTQYPELINRLEPIANNGRISLFKRKASNHQQSLMEFMDLKAAEKRGDFMAGLDSSEASPWKKWKDPMLDSLNEETTIRSAQEGDIALLFNAVIPKNESERYNQVLITGEILQAPGASDFTIVHHIHQDIRNEKYQEFSSSYWIKKQGEFQPFSILLSSANCKILGAEDWKLIFRTSDNQELTFRSMRAQYFRH